MADGFTTTYAPGPSWEAGRKLEEQAGFPEQVRGWQAHAKEGRLRMIGLLADRPDVVVVAWFGMSREDVDALVAAGPCVRSGRLIATTSPGEPRPCGTSMDLGA